MTSIPQSKVQDVVHATLLVSDAYIGTSVDINDLLTHLSANTNIDPLIKAAFAKEIAKYQDSSVMQSIQSTMRALRNMSPVMKREAQKVVNHVFGITIVLLLIVGFILFHMLYTTGGDRSVMGIALIMLIIIVITAFYHWIVGVMQS